jgi:hypothetical protein
VILDELEADIKHHALSTTKVGEKVFWPFYGHRSDKVAAIRLPTQEIRLHPEYSQGEREIFSPVFDGHSYCIGETEWATRTAERQFKKAYFFPVVLNVNQSLQRFPPGRGRQCDHLRCMSS